MEGRVTIDLSDTEQEMLDLLTGEPQRCASLGTQLWHFGRGLRAQGNSTCPWARPAGAVLHRLKAKGLAKHVQITRWVSGWVRT